MKLGSLARLASPTVKLLGADWPWAFIIDQRLVPRQHLAALALSCHQSTLMQQCRSHLLLGRTTGGACFPSAAFRRRWPIVPHDQRRLGAVLGVFSQKQGPPPIRCCSGNVASATPQAALKETALNCACEPSSFAFARD